MGSSTSVPVPPRKPVPNGKTRLCVAGFTVSPYTGRARTIAAQIAKLYPEEYETWFYFGSSTNYYDFLKLTFDPIPFPPHLKGHGTSPFVWTERGATNEIEPIGGLSHFKEWVEKQDKVAKEQSIRTLLDSWLGVGDVWHNKEDAPQSTADISE